MNQALCVILYDSYSALGIQGCLFIIEAVNSFTMRQKCINLLPNHFTKVIIKIETMEDIHTTIQIKLFILKYVLCAL